MKDEVTLTRKYETKDKLYDTFELMKEYKKRNIRLDS